MQSNQIWMFSNSNGGVHFISEDQLGDLWRCQQLVVALLGARLINRSSILIHVGYCAIANTAQVADTIYGSHTRDIK